MGGKQNKPIGDGPPHHHIAENARRNEGDSTRGTGPNALSARGTGSPPCLWRACSSRHRGLQGLLRDRVSQGVGNHFYVGGDALP